MATEIAPQTLRADAQRNRERILAAAADLFRARGLDVSMEDIAHQAGVGVGTLYRRFSGREALIDALFDSRIAELTEMLDETAAIEDAWQALVHLIERTLAKQAKDRGLKQLFHSRHHGHPAVADIRRRLIEQFATLVERAQAAGELRPGIDAMDVVLISFQAGAIADLTSEQAPDAWRRALALGLEGLRPRGEGADPVALPGAALTRRQFEASLECWRPPASPVPAGPAPADPPAAD